MGTQLLHRGRVKVNDQFKRQLITYRKLVRQSRSNVIFETIKLHWLLLPELEVDIVLVFRDALRLFFLMFMLICLFSTVTGHPQD